FIVVLAATTSAESAMNMKKTTMKMSIRPPMPRGLGRACFEFSRSRPVTQDENAFLCSARRRASASSEGVEKTFGETITDSVTRLEERPGDSNGLLVRVRRRLPAAPRLLDDARRGQNSLL